jgi:hypothetical protein
MVQVSSECEVPRGNSDQIRFKFKTRNFSEFSFKIHFEPEEVPMEKLVPLFKLFNYIFYLKFFEQEKSIF